MSAGAPLEIVLHVPKCAGSTIETHLLRHLGPLAFWSPRRRARALPLELFGRKYDGRPPGPLDGIRAISGHYIGRSVERRFAERRIRRSVLIREPRALVLSWYNYRQMRYRSLGQAGYSFALHLDTLPPDPLTHFLLANWLEVSWPRLAAMDANEKLARLEAALADFDFVGDVSDCDRLVADLSSRLGIPAVAEPVNTETRWRQEIAFTPARHETLTAEERARLEARTQLDRALWLRVARGELAEIGATGTASFFRSELRRPVAEIRRRRARARPADPGAQP